MHFGHRESPIGYGMWRFFPFIPLLFPIGILLSLLGLTTWFSYLSYKELSTMRHGETYGTTHGTSGTQGTMTS